MTTDKLTLRYVPLSEARLWDRNPKPHDLSALVQSFTRYGFKDPPKFEPDIQDDGGTVEGNGRLEALAMMQQSGADPPRGIATNGDGWLVPILFGVDAKSRTEAEAYAIDHNSLTVMGGNFGEDWIGRLYDLEGVTSVLGALAEQDALPVSISSDDLDSLIEALKTPVPPEGWPEPNEETEQKCPKCGYEWR